MAASFEVALRCRRFCQGKTPIDDHLKFFFLDEVEEGELSTESGNLSCDSLA